MRPFTFERATDAQSAVNLVAADPEASFIAGGTELLNWLKDGLASPGKLIDINALPLTAIETRPDGLRIGALARMSDVAREADVRQGYPVLAEALEKGAS